MSKKTVKDIAVSGKKVLVRVDFNVPLEGGKVADDKRIAAALPTIQYLVGQGAKVILMSHLGRPKGEVKPEFSLAPAAERLAELLPGTRVSFAPDVIGRGAREMIAGMQDGDVVLLENLRFHKEETDNDPAFAKDLADLGEIYVNDAFGSAHRAHASTEGVAKYLPAVSGLLMGKELSIMGSALEHPQRPFVAILGGAKISDKIGVIKNLLTKCDTLLIGGGMANTFIRAMGRETGTSLVDEDSLSLAKELMAQAEAKGVDLLLPIDVVVAAAFKDDAPHKTVLVDAIPADMMALDIGPATAKIYANVVKTAQTVIWNGPMGVFEMTSFAGGTKAVAQACAESSATTIIGGGDSASAVKKLGYADKVTHISTGGGASLEFLEGIELPGVAALNDK